MPVKLPKEVLDLFPMWEYQCSNCGKIYDEQKHICIKCGTPIDLSKNRVPPRFFKSHETLSKYAHEVLAPKLTPEQRELLFQYFTEFFNDGFETGLVPPWDETQIGGGCTFTMISSNGSPSHHGDWLAKSYTDGDNEYAACRKDFAGGYPRYLRGYFRFPSLPSSGKCFVIMLFEQSGVGRACTFFLWNNGGTYTWKTIGYYGGSWRTAIDTTNTPSTDTWICCEIGYGVGSGPYHSEFWIDGNGPYSSAAGWGPRNSDRGYFGQNLTTGGGEPTREAGTVYVDCCVLADTYIGPEAAGETYTKTWTTDTLFKKLDIPKTLSVDAAFQKQDIPKIFGLDVAFQKSFTLQRQVDALFEKLDVLKAFGIDVDFLKRDIVKSFAVDARFGALTTRIISRQIDVLLKKLNVTKSFGVDVYFGGVEAETYAKNFGLDAIFAYKVRLPELWLDEEGKLVLNISKPYTWVGS